MHYISSIFEFLTLFKIVLKINVISNQLTSIATIFSVLVETILKLDTRELILTESVNSINKCHNALSTIIGAEEINFKK